jgi:hypothetical protein
MPQTVVVAGSETLSWNFTLISAEGLVVGSARATELVGDQLEARPAEGNLRFWLSITWLLVVFSWRTVVGILAGSTVGVIFSLAPFRFAFTRHHLGPFPLHTPYDLAISLLSWTAAVFSLVQFGSRSHLARIALVYAALATIDVCTLWLPFGSAAVLAGATLFLLLCVRRSKDRRAVVVLFSALASGGIIMRIMASLPRPDRKWVLMVVLVQLLIMGGVECTVALILHKRLLDSAEIQSETV